MNSKHNSMLALLAAGLLIANGAHAQWSRNAPTLQTFLTNSTDLVGIGTSTPAYKLDVQSAGIATMQFKSTNDNASILLDRGSAGSTASLTYKSQGAGRWQTGIISNDNYNIRNNILALPAITILSTNNNVGLGIGAPTQRLHVAGNILATGNLNAVNVTASGSVNAASLTTSGNVNAVSFIGTGNIDVSGYVGFGSVEQLTDGGANTIASNSNFVPLNDCSSSLGTSSNRWQNVLACGRISAGTTSGVAAQLSVAHTTLSGVTGIGSFQIGETSTFNLVMDNNEIQSRNNGVANTLFLQFNGGNLDVNSGGGNASFHGDVLVSAGLLGVGSGTPSTSFRATINETANAALLLGTLNGVASYLTVNKPTASTATEILRVRDNGSTTATFNTTANAFALIVNGSAQASGGTWQNSDRRIKTEITPLSTAMDNIMKLNPTSYYFNRTEDNKYLNLPNELQFGLIAQEVKDVFPNIVRESTTYDEDGKARPQTLYSVNYTALIPVLIKGMQEQEKTISVKNEELETVKSELAALKETVNKLDEALAQCCMSYGEKKAVGVIATEGARLEQNAPNPFSENTVVKFYIPQSFKSAMVKIYSMTGEEMKSFKISAAGLGQVEISGNSMTSGVYQYTLLIDGKAVDSKQMILTK